MAAKIAPAMMTIRDAWTLGRDHLSPYSPTPQLDARLLLEHVTGLSHTGLIAHDDRRLSAEQQQQFDMLLARAAQFEPIPYLIGTAPFFEMDLRVGSAVLIPRPETEQLVDSAVARARRVAHHPHIVDVGTGSGAIAIAMARRLPQAQVLAVDISAEALTMAVTNAHQFAPDRVAFLQSDLLSATAEMPHQPFDLILANLPYVTDAEWTQLDVGVKWYEPELALKGGADGLDLIRDLLRQAQTRLSPEGVIFLEIGWQQGAAAADVARSFFPTARIAVEKDFGGHDRLVTIELAEEKAE